MLLDLLTSYPSQARTLGRGMVSVALLLALLTLRLDKVLHRLDARGLPHLALETILPGWIYWAVPETFPGWFTWTALLISGATLAVAAKRVERML
jgi:hypothetical protein